MGGELVAGVGFVIWDLGVVIMGEGWIDILHVILVWALVDLLYSLAWRADINIRRWDLGFEE